jgi:DNA repair protein RecO (recombination protein O)
MSGGAICSNCGRNCSDAYPISKDALKYLRHFQRSSYDDAKKAKISQGVNTEIEQVMYHYLTHVLEKKLKTPSFLKRMIYERSLSSKN